MSRDPRLNMSMAAAMLGLEQNDGLAGAFAVALVMHTQRPWEQPTGAALERARKAAARFKLSRDLAIFLPPEPGFFAGRRGKDAYRGVVIALKRLDALEGDARASTITQVRLLLGSR